METCEVNVFDTSADLFANSSTETVKSNLDQTGSVNLSQYDNVPTIHGNISIAMNASAISNAAQYVSEVCNSVNRVYCPFCPFEFNYEFVLKDHIKSSHSKELKEVTQAKISPFFACPFCHAKFYLKELLPRHIFRKHEDSLIGVFSTGVADEYLQCNFCPHRVLRKHYKLIMIHIEKKHFGEFQKCVETKYPKTFLSCEDLTRELESKPKVLTPGLSRKLENMHCDSPNSKVKSILKSPTNSPCRSNFSLDGDFNDMTHQIQLSNSVRRKLKFDLPESPEENKENSFAELKLKFPENDTSFSSRFKNLFKSKNKIPIKSSPKQSPKKEKLPTLFITSSPIQKDSPKNKSYLRHDIDFKKEKGIAMLTGYQFKCGLCSESFETNANLLNHLHKSHRGIKLRAQYRCGECHAKFYRNSYLVRHCWFHHTPKCLKYQNSKSF